MALLGRHVRTYALAGVKAGMFMMHLGRAPTATKLQTHKDKSWSKLSGWAYMIRLLLLDTSNSTYDNIDASFGPLYDCFLPRSANYKRIVPEYDPRSVDQRWKTPLFNAGNLALSILTRRICAFARR